MGLILALWLLACGAPPQETVVVVHADARELIVVDADSTLARYGWAGPQVPLEPGERVALDREDGRARVTQRLAMEPGPIPRYPLTGVVLEVKGSEVVVLHEAIEGVMARMAMPFQVPPELAAELSPGDHLEATLLGAPSGWTLAGITRLGREALPPRHDLPELKVGEPLPRLEGVGGDGRPVVLGEGQGVRTAIGFLYTRCPNPEFCPALVARLLALQAQLKAGRIVTVSLDPDHDSPEVLGTYGEGVGADPARWTLARLEPDALATLARHAGQIVLEREGLIAHQHRLLVLDADGRVLERYDDNRWPLERVVRQLQEGQPVGLHPM